MSVSSAACFEGRERERVIKDTEKEKEKEVSHFFGCGDKKNNKKLPSIPTINIEANDTSTANQSRNTYNPHTHNVCATRTPTTHNIQP